MSMHIGIDVGVIGLKAALLADKGTVQAGQIGGQALRRLQDSPDGRYEIWVAEYRRTRGRPMQTLSQWISQLLDVIGRDQIGGITVTGSGGDLAAKALRIPRCNEFQAITRAIDLLHPQVRTVFEIGGETSKFLRLEPDPGSGILGIMDYSTNGDCAAGTGAFLDQQASRLKYAVEDIGRVVSEAERSAQIAGRCSVFAKSDMIHSQQKGFSPPEVLRGLCNAVATNYRSAVVKGREPKAPIALLGGGIGQFGGRTSLDRSV